MIKTANYKKTRDSDIREAFIQNLNKSTNSSKQFVLSEFTITDCNARVDVAVFGNSSHGYEFKSDMDNLKRLYDQRDAYNAFFDRVTLVVGKTHVIDSLDIIPEWWGITLAKYRDNKIVFLPLRSARQNPHQDLSVIANQLWKSEAISLLNSNGLSNKHKETICEIITNHFSPKELKELVNEKITYRYKYYLSDLSCELYGD